VTLLFGSSMLVFESQHLNDHTLSYPSRHKLIPDSCAVLYGTSRIVQLLGPTVFIDTDAQTFFLTFRVFEICRSLIYSESSFLYRNIWKNISKQIWQGHSDGAWRAKEELLDLMLECSELNQEYCYTFELNSLAKKSQSSQSYRYTRRFRIHQYPIDIQPSL